jgi:tRNA(fMet)-specific endonuclease VapC
MPAACLSRALFLASYTRGHTTGDSPQPILDRIENDLLADVGLLSYDDASAREFGHARGGLLRQGLSVGSIDLMTAAVALAHDLTLVTHNTRDYQYVPGLRIEDWLQP